MLVAQLFKAVAAEIWVAKIIWVVVGLVVANLAAADLVREAVVLAAVDLAKAVVDLVAADSVVKVVLVMAIMACKTF